MNNLKYRSVMSALVLCMLSVFLFTGCEKDTAVAPDSKSNNMLDKFKRLKFQTVTTTEKDKDNNFADNNSSSTEFTQPNAGGDAQFAPSTGMNDQFTDPSSTDAEFFGVNGMFGLGGGTFTFKGKTHDIGFGFCGSDIFGQLGGRTENVDIFIGVAGDWSLDQGSSEPTSGYVIYAVSYNGSTNLKNFYDYQSESEIHNAAFVMIVDVSEDVDGSDIYFSTGGSLTFSGSTVSMAGVRMVDSEGKNVGQVDANLECVNAFDFELDYSQN